MSILIYIDTYVRKTVCCVSTVFPLSFIREEEAEIKDSTVNLVYYTYMGMWLLNLSFILPPCLSASLFPWVDG